MYQNVPLEMYNTKLNLLVKEKLEKESFSNFASEINLLGG